MDIHDLTSSVAYGGDLIKTGERPRLPMPFERACIHPPNNPLRYKDASSISS